MEEKCVKFIVSGKVQGVGFRYHTSYQGKNLNLTGYAKNLDNGDVEVMARGREENLKKLELWLLKGPQMSRVDSLQRDDVELQEFKDFNIRY
ncbi:acylphosphatase [Vibrio sonorensis]|uniref:acylphosphatase n=1 Tax=Vibrio sonorensis TaxID=1004316 RepID=UPI0008DA7910|nr:acylphosphatase [Vibrio sonorensis]